ncbi:MAG: hypothetical protein AMJ92_12505 [candidate division Zixibacteria bacterium SM23_81]|nr:MAG: hypothetical protein AMJ92_12505 [candidate division Zixibacteria bacterium SM23_81]
MYRESLARFSGIFFPVDFQTVKGWKLSAQLCRGHSDDRKSMGAGTEEIEGDVKRDVLIQLSGNGNSPL